MEWTDDGIVLSARKHGETSAIVTLLTREHGRHLGLVRGGSGKRARGILQPGNRVEARWQARLAEHLGVPGIDGVYVGPSDLSLSYGLSPAPEQTDPAFNAAIDDVLAACARHNIVPGIAGNAQVAVRRQAQGFRFLEVSRDSAVLQRGAREDVETVRAAMG